MANPTSPVSDRSTRDTVQAFFDAQAAGEPQAVVDLFAPDATWVIPGDPSLVPWVGARDRDGIPAYLVAQAENATATSFTMHKVLVDGENAVALGRFGYRFASGGSIDDPFAAHLVVRDGLIHSFIIHEDSLNLAREYTGTRVVGD